MQLINKWLFLSLLVVLLSCDDQNKKSKSPFELTSKNLKSTYELGEDITFFIHSEPKTAFDSIEVFLNQQKIKAITQDNFSYVFENDKFGYQNFDFKIHFQDNLQSINYRIELVTNHIPQLLAYDLLNEFYHDNTAYTQGFEFYNSFLLESTGQFKASTLRKLNPKTGEVLMNKKLDDNFFGEGLTVLRDTIYQITWQNKTAILYDAKTLAEIKRLTYPKDIEGWGITNDGTHLYMTDGTEKIWKINPTNFEVVDYVNVYSRGQKIIYLNELEWIDGLIYANVYQSDNIIAINPTNGEVQSILNLSDLKTKINTAALDLNNDVLNGIAYHPINKTLFVTGKHWEKMFEIRLK